MANNIANLNTSGYKARQRRLPGTPDAGRALEPVRGATGASASSPIARPGTTFAQGPVQLTGNPLDVAISGNAFLTVQTPRGERYTRNGALQINNQGQLVTSEGLQVVGQSGPIVFQPNDRDISIGIDGTISVREGQNTTDAQRGKLKLVSFAAPQRLQKDGTSTYMAPAGVTAQEPATDAASCRA